MSRFWYLRWLFFILLGLLVVRLAHLQLVRGDDYRRLAEQNRLRLVPAQAPRGPIVDRRGRVLASNQTIFRVAVVPQEVDDLPAILAHVSTLVHRSPEALERDYRRARSLPFLPATLVPHVAQDVAIRLEEERWRLPGLLIKPDVVRSYPRGSSASHLLGYLSKPRADELPRLKSYGVRPLHLVGRTGLERLLDDELRGRSGGLMVEVDHQRDRLVSSAGGPNGRGASDVDHRREAPVAHRAGIRHASGGRCRPGS